MLGNRSPTDEGGKEGGGPYQLMQVSYRDMDIIKNYKLKFA